MTAEQTRIGHPIFTYQSNSAGYLQVAVLPVGTTKITTYDGWDTCEEFLAVITPRYPQDLTEVSNEVFDAECLLRTTHTAGMLELLRNNYMQQDLTGCYVYGSPIHPISSTWARFQGAVYFDSDKKVSGYHSYVAVPALLDTETVRHYSFVFISHP